MHKVQREAAEFKDKWGKTIWDSSIRHKETDDPEGNWRAYRFQQIAKDHKYNDWFTLLHICHVPEDMCENPFKRPFGLTSIHSICSVDDDTFKGYLISMSKYKYHDEAVPFTVAPCFRALRLWGRLYRLVHGEYPTANKFTAGEALKAHNRHIFASNLLVNPIDNPSPPEKFKSFKVTSWRTFHDATTTYIAGHRGRNGFPLSYLIRPQDEYPMDEIVTKYGDDLTDDFLIHAVKLDFTNPDVSGDNESLYKLLLPLVQGTDAWEFCKSRQLVNNGRGVWQALITQGDGDVTKAQRRWDARNVLAHTVMEKGRPR